MATQIAMERALNAEIHTKWLGSKCRNELEKNACTALTNLETCRAGFIELGVSDFMLPLMSNNVSKLISNTLAINNGST
ncbi:hypothetical protein CsSME_00029014 [Camellia sinensis var. sinensis]